MSMNNHSDNTLKGTSAPPYVSGFLHMALFLLLLFSSDYLIAADKKSVRSNTVRSNSSASRKTLSQNLKNQFKSELFNPSKSLLFQQLPEQASFEHVLASSEHQAKAELTPICQFQPNAGPEMVLIAEGQFKMGSPENEPDRYDNESPQHTVNILKPFAISRCEVTVAEFKRFVEATGYKTDAEKGNGCYVWDAKASTWNQKIGSSWRNPGFSQQDNHPVVCVSWLDANQYIQWLNNSLKLTDKTYRLPSEAEWEYAARAGTTTPFFWGKQSLCDYANGYDSSQNCKDGFDNTAPVQSFKPNAWGLYDMSGNVWEWVADCWHGSYKGAPDDGRAWQAGQGECTQRSVRGGGWSDYPWNLRSAIRDRYEPDATFNFQGFRLAKTL